MRLMFVVALLSLTGCFCVPVQPCGRPIASCVSDSECTAGLRCLPPADGSCLSSSCTCNTFTGQLTCTSDCMGKRCRAPDVDAGVDAGVPDAGVPDAGRQDAGLCANFVAPCSSDFDCNSGQSCLPPIDRRCHPSACSCDPTTGEIECSADCSGKECRQTSDAGACEGFEAPCSGDHQCGPGRACLRDGSCRPSACRCDPSTGDVICTEDCGGGVCGVAVDAGPVPDGGCQNFRLPCLRDSECYQNEICSHDECAPSACACTASGVVCTADCNGGICRPVSDAGVPDGGACVGFVPPCIADSQCGAGNSCVIPLNACLPSTCACDPMTGSIICSSDCNGGECRPPSSDAGVCANFVPPCGSDLDCGAGRRCERLAGRCLPSSCACDTQTGLLSCTDDCGGGVCVVSPDAGVPDAGLCSTFEPPCTSSAQCTNGRQCQAPPNACTPTACGCDPSTGNITCSADCGGRRCLP